jgi:superfamily II DNA or RNA helicase
MIVEIYPSFCKVLNASVDELRNLREFLTVEVPGARFTQLFRKKMWDGKKSFFYRPSGKFPIGFLNRVKENFFLTENQIVDKRRFIDFKYMMPKLNGIELRPYQKDSILHCLDYKNCIIESATNSGKSAVIAGLCKVFKDFKLLILIQRIELLRQLRTMIEDMTGIQTGFIASFDRDVRRNIVVAMVPTLEKRIEVDEDITYFYKNTDVLIVDEFHHAKSAVHQRLLSNSPAVLRFGFSGTIPPEDTYDGWLVRMYIGDVAIKISNDELVQQGISAKPLITMVENDVSFVNKFSDRVKAVDSIEEKRKIAQTVFRDVMREGIVRNSTRNELIIGIIRKEQQKGLSILVIVEIIEHGDELLRLCQEAGLNAKYVQGSSPDRRDLVRGFAEGLFPILIATVIVDEGLDIPRIGSLILASGKKSKRQYLQRIGRSLRRKSSGENVVYVHDFLDIGNKYLEKHSKLRKKLYLEEGFAVTVVKNT